jgi:Flp pilus assembly protein TadG
MSRILRDEAGEGLISGLVLLAGVMLPLMFLIAVFGRVETARLAAQQAARDAVRSAVQASTPAQARANARAALGRARGDQGGARLRLALDGDLLPGKVMTARVSTNVAVGHVPLIGSIGIVSVTGHASAPVDRYRSVVTDGRS